MKIKYSLLVVLTYFFTALSVISCQSNNEKKDNHKEHKHQEHDHQGHNHSHSDKKNTETPDQDCKNCGMPADDENWRVKYTPSSKENTFFCSPKCYFKASTTEKQYTKSEFVHFAVFGQNPKTIEAKKAYFIIGTDEKAPMGKDFLVTDSPENAKKLLEEKKGKEIVTFEKIKN